MSIFCCNHHTKLTNQEVNFLLETCCVFVSCTQHYILICGIILWTQNMFPFYFLFLYKKNNCRSIWHLALSFCLDVILLMFYFFPVCMNSLYSLSWSTIVISSSWTNEWNDGFLSQKSTLITYEEERLVLESHLTLPLWCTSSNAKRISLYTSFHCSSSDKVSRDVKWCVKVPWSHNSVWIYKWPPSIHVWW